MLHERGIYALSPELGLADKNTEHFFISSKDTLKKLLVRNFGWIEYTMKLLVESIKCNIVNSKGINETSQENSTEMFTTVNTEVECWNNGL